MRHRLSSVCMQGDLACDPGKTQQAGVMMQPVTAWLSLFYLENTSHLPPNLFAASLTQMCHQMHAESEECCLKWLCLYTGRLIVVVLPAPLEYGDNTSTGLDVLLPQEDGSPPSASYDGTLLGPCHAT